ncbi:MAG: hypothetical protein ACO1OQ_04855 [Rufibacter sp.]
MVFRRLSSPAYKSTFAVAALLYLLVCFFSVGPGHPTQPTTKFAKLTLLGKKQSAKPLTWKASEPIDATSGILHEAEASLLPLLFALAAFLSFPLVRNLVTVYSRPVYNVCRLFRILPNAP